MASVGFKVFADGSAAPGSWTDIDVLECFPEPLAQEVYVSDAGKSNYDGTAYAYSRGRYRVTIRFGPKCVAANAATVASIIAAQNTYIKDTRVSWLGSSNTIAFVRAGDVRYTRDMKSLALVDVTIEYISAAAV